MSVLNQNSPIECYKLNILSIFCIIIFVLSLFFNFSLLMIFVSFKKLRTNINVLIIFITFMNLFMTITVLPFVIQSNLHCRFLIILYFFYLFILFGYNIKFVFRWTLNRFSCYLEGFITFFVGCIQIFSITSMSLQR
jgi:hypothetical protein